jgi:arginine/ornithine N-succinyltransferase beta subunit
MYYFLLSQRNFQKVQKLNMTMNVAFGVTNPFYTKCYKCLVYFSKTIYMHKDMIV